MRLLLQPEAKAIEYLARFCTAQKSDVDSSGGVRGARLRNNGPLFEARIAMLWNFDPMSLRLQGGSQNDRQRNESRIRIASLNELCRLGDIFAENQFFFERIPELEVLEGGFRSPAVCSVRWVTKCHLVDGIIGQGAEARGDVDAATCRPDHKMSDCVKGKRFLIGETRFY